MNSNLKHLIRKEALHIWRDGRTLFVMILIPVTLMLLFGFAISTEVNNVKVGVVASEWSETVEQNVQRISANPYFEYKGRLLSSETDKWLRTGEVTAVIVYTSDFERKQQRANSITTEPLIQIITDASNPNEARAATMYLQNELLALNSQQDLFEMRMLFNPQMRSAYTFVPGIMGLIFILICALMTSVSIVREKENGTMEVLLVSPVSPIKIIFAKMAPYFAISCLLLTIILMIAYFILDVPLSNGIGGIIVVSLLYLVLSLSLGLLVSTFTQSQVVAMLVSVAVMLFPVIMFSGMIFPIENLPPILRPISYAVPARWYIDAMRKMMIEGLPLTEVGLNLLILSLMTLVLIGGALKKFNNQLE